MVPALTNAAEIKVLSTQATEEAYRQLVPQFEKATGHKVTTLFTGTLDADKRLAAGEAYDLLIMSKDSPIEQHMKSGKVIQEGAASILHVRALVSALKAGAPKPDISSGRDALKRTELIQRQVDRLFDRPEWKLRDHDVAARLGIADQVKLKLKQTASGVFVGSIIASGEVEIGFQQVSELSQFEGVDYVGPLPADVQNYTVFSSGILAGAKEAEAARALVRFITSPQAGAVYRRRGMEPG